MEVNLTSEDAEALVKHLEFVCPSCGYGKPPIGLDEQGKCSHCHGAGTVTTEAGDCLLAFLRRHLAIRTEPPI